METSPSNFCYSVNLDLCQTYSSRFENFTHIASSLSGLLKGVQRMVLIEAAKSAFEARKITDTKPPCLLLASWSEPIAIWSDASNKARKVVLQQHGYFLVISSMKQKELFYL